MSSWVQRPLRVKLTVLVVMLVFAGLAISAVASTTALRGYLVDRVDEQLTAGARPFREIAGPLPVSLPVEQFDQGARPPSPFYIALVDGSSVTVLSEPSGAPSAPTLPSDLTTLFQAPVTVDGQAGDGRWRVLAFQAPSGVLVTALPLADAESTVARLVLLLVVIGVVVVVIAGLTGFLLVRRSLRPLEDMATTAHAIADGDLTQRVPQGPTSAEVEELAASFNTMVTRIEESFSAQQASEADARESEERMRRFVADAGHELRTPLTSIRGYAELLEEGAATDPAVAVARIQDEATRMGALVDDLQTLARLDEQVPLDLAPVSLARVAERAVADARAAHPERTIGLEATDADATVVGDARALRQVVDNLLSNAVRYSDEGSPIAVTVTATSVDVTDRGVGLTAEEQERVFDRLYRTDEARSRVHGGSGLGLAIVRSIVQAHGGEVSVSSVLGEGSTFGFTLPEPVD